MMFRHSAVIACSEASMAACMRAYEHTHALLYDFTTSHIHAAKNAECA